VCKQVPEAQASLLHTLPGLKPVKNTAKMAVPHGVGKNNIKVQNAKCKNDEIASA